MSTINNNYPDETFCIDNRRFLYLKFCKQNKYNALTYTKLNKHLDAISKFCNKNTTSALVDVRDIFGVISIDYSCLKLLAKDIRLKKGFKKIAFITNSIPLKYKIDNYIRKYNPNVLTRVYNNIDDGIDFCISK